MTSNANRPQKSMDDLNAAQDLLASCPPRPWHIVPAIPGSGCFIRAADDKTVAIDLRSEAVAQLIVEAVNAL